MRRIVITTGTTVAGVVLLLSLKPHHQAVSAAPPTAPEPSAPGGSTTSAGPASGTYRGRTVHTRYGPVQVEVTMTKGRLTAVRALRTPFENGRDRAIAAFAIPRLNRKAVAAGGARIDTVSGATYTSEGYITSLQSALDRAHA